MGTPVVGARRCWHEIFIIVISMTSVEDLRFIPTALLSVMEKHHALLVVHGYNGLLERPVAVVLVIMLRSMILG